MIKKNTKKYIKHNTKKFLPKLKGGFLGPKGSVRAERVTGEGNGQPKRVGNDLPKVVTEAGNGLPKRVTEAGNGLPKVPKVLGNGQQKGRKGVDLSPATIKKIENRLHLIAQSKNQSLFKNEQNLKPSQPRFVQQLSEKNFYKLQENAKRASKKLTRVNQNILQGIKVGLVQKDLQSYVNSLFTHTATKPQINLQTANIIGKEMPTRSNIVRKQLLEQGQGQGQLNEQQIQNIINYMDGLSKIYSL